MKKFLLSFILFFTMAFMASAQLLQLNGYKNTLWTGFGNSWNTAASSGEKSKEALDSQNWGYLNEDDDNRWAGVLDTFQANFTSKNLYIDLMLQWSSFSTYDLSGDLDYVTYQYVDSDVNFILNVTENFDIAMGTYLNWKLGPAPSHGGNSWEIGYHLKQGGLFYGNPGQGLVAGAAFYANYINESLELAKKTSTTGPIEPVTEALAARFSIADVLQISGAIPSGTTSDDFIANVGVRFTPVEQLLIAAAYNGVFRKDSNLYTGFSIGANSATLEGWFAMNNIGGKHDNKITGIGGAITFTANEITLRPEAGLTFYENSNFSTAGYAGIDVGIGLSKNLQFNVWGSLAKGSEDDRSGSGTKTDGKIFDIRPNLSYYINSTDALAASYEYQYITTKNDDDFNFWQLGFFWTHAF